MPGSLDVQMNKKVKLVMPLASADGTKLDVRTCPGLIREVQAAASSSSGDQAIAGWEYVPDTFDFTILVFTQAPGVIAFTMSAYRQNSFGGQADKVADTFTLNIKPGNGLQQPRITATLV